MLHNTPTRRRFRHPIVLLMAALMLGGALAGCGSDDDTASTVTTATPDSSDNGDATEALADACRDTDLEPVEQAADNFLAAQSATDGADTVV